MVEPLSFTITGLDRANGLTSEHLGRNNIRSLVVLYYIAFSESSLVKQVAYSRVTYCECFELAKHLKMHVLSSVRPFMYFWFGFMFCFDFIMCF